MSSIVEGYAYDIFISYRQKDNKHLATASEPGWVTAFVSQLKEELDATFKHDISIYFDENPHDGLGATHHVNKSLEGKLKCLILIPIISRTYCDPGSFAWRHELLAFRDLARADAFGLDIQLPNRNFASRILPIQIHDISNEDQLLFEKENGGPLRSIPFIFRSQGVNRPLVPADTRAENLNKSLYRDQINKTANAVEEIINALNSTGQPVAPKQKSRSQSQAPVKPTQGLNSLWSELQRRNVLRAGFAYIIMALALRQLTALLLTSSEFLLIISITLLAIFPLAMVAAWRYEMSPSGLILTNSQASADNPYSPSQKKPFTGGLIVVLTVLVLVLIYVKPPKPILKETQPQKSIAIVPFKNRSENVKDAYLAEGLTDEVINRLTVLSDLRVYKAKGDNYDSIAKRLGPITILIGSVQRLGDRVQITAQFIESRTENVIWGSTFTRNTNDVMAIQSDVAKRIAEVLKVKISEVERARLEHRTTSNSSAFDYYLKGRKLYKWYKKDSNNLAIEQFKLALALDPDYASAWAGLGDAYSQMHTRFGMEVKWVDSSLTAGAKAIRLDPNSSEGYKALANAYAKARRYDTAVVLLRKAIELDPNNTAAIGNLGTDYMLLGDYSEALKWEKKAAGLDPNNWIPFQITGWIYRWIDDLPQAENWLKKSLALDSTRWDTYELLAYCYVSQGRNAEALALVPRVLALDSTNSRTLEIAGLIAHFAGDKAKAKRYFQKSIDNNESFRNDPVTISPIGLSQILLEEGNRVEADIFLTRTLDINLKEIARGSLDDDPPFYISGIYAIRGEREKSLEWLKKAIAAKWIDYAQVVHGPWFVRYRNDPDFVALIDELRKKTAAMRAKVDNPVAAN